MKIKHTDIPQFGDRGTGKVRPFQAALFAKGFDPGMQDDWFGVRTRDACSRFQLSRGLQGSGLPGPRTMALLGYEVILGSSGTVTEPGVIAPKYPLPHPFHPRFDDQLPKPYTHIHPLDVARSVAGEKEIPGSKDNPFIAHLHEHAGNLGTHSEGADYHDEVPHCSSGLNWAADMAGARKTNNALASSWSKYGNPREGDWVEEGDIIHIKNGSQNHVTMANERFNRKKAKTFDGFGFNQGNSIKTSSYKTSSIQSVQVWEPLPGTVWAPIGFLGMKPIASTGGEGESVV